MSSWVEGPSKAKAFKVCRSTRKESSEQATDSVVALVLVVALAGPLFHLPATMGGVALKADKMETLILVSGGPKVPLRMPQECLPSNVNAIKSNRFV